MKCDVRRTRDGRANPTCDMPTCDAQRATCATCAA
ncbi:hypothetical protein BPC006_II2968 [Burkholderia pseudomallei BPC006]|nr:hypothetical protein BPC006_II2968 [Burkholderia pseudomallei BPC006]